MKLDQWCVVSRTFPSLPPPEQERCCLHGQVTGHPRCSDGKKVTTSLVVSRDGDNGVTKSGSAYELGEPDPAYEARSPNARQRLLAGLRPALAVLAAFEI